MSVEELISKMKPEHAEVIQKHFDDVSAELTEKASELETVKTEVAELSKSLEDANSELDELRKAAESAGEEDEGDGDEAAKAGPSFDEEEVLKAMPEPARELFLKERAKREAAEDQVRKAKDAEEHASAVAKAAELKALPVEQEKLVDIVKNADDAIIDLLTTVSNAIENTVLTEIGKSGGGDIDAGDSEAGWAKIEAEAAKAMESDPSLTKQRAIAQVVKTKPELYKEYLQGGAN